MNISYSVCENSTYYIFQLKLTNISQSLCSDVLKDFQEEIDGAVYDKGRIALLFIKNYQAVHDIFGRNTIQKMEGLMTTAFNEVFGEEYSLLTNGQLYILFDPSNDEHMASKFEQIVSLVNKASFETGIDILFQFKAGISGYERNKYTALQEARFALKNIFDGEQEIMEYVQPNKKSFLEYIIRNDLPYAIEKNELELMFQGIFDIHGNELYGFEVLLRWNHMKYGKISPGDFIPIAERSDIIAEIDLWVLETALKEFASLNESYRSKLKLNFNVSPKDFYCNGFVNRFIEIVQQSEIPSENIILELTETLNLSPKKDSIIKLKNAGIKVALDDFGSGFTSLSKLKHLNIDYLKIDLSFIHDINKSYESTQIISSILSMAASLGIDVIAEGIEDQEQLKFLMKRKCGLGQGYLLHKPVSFDRLIQIIEEQSGKDWIEQTTQTMSKKDYYSNYQYGRYIYIMLDASGRIKCNDDRLSIILDQDVQQEMTFDSLIDEHLIERFRFHLDEVKKKHGECVFATEIKGKGKLLPVIISMEYNATEDTIDLFIENFEHNDQQFEKMRSLYHRYDIIFNNIRSAVITTNLNQMIQEWNDGATAIFGYSRDEPLARI